jgi:hypothetical protein
MCTAILAVEVWFFYILTRGVRTSTEGNTHYTGGRGSRSATVRGYGLSVEETHHVRFRVRAPPCAHRRRKLSSSGADLAASVASL